MKIYIVQLYHMISLQNGTIMIIQRENGQVDFVTSQGYLMTEQISVVSLCLLTHSIVSVSVTVIVLR